MTFAVPITALGLVVVVLLVALALVVTQRRARARERGLVEALARAVVVEHGGDAVVVLDPDGRVVHHSDAAEALLGPIGGGDPQRPPGARSDAAASPDDALGVAGRPLDARLTPLRDANGVAVGSVLWVRDGARGGARDDAGDARTRALSASDEIMGIPNRRHFLELVRRELLRARRYGRPLALVAIRIDRFADTVAAHGVEVADALLRAVAATVVADLRATDSLGRMGDDALAICLPDADAAWAQAEAERLRDEIGQIEVRAAGADVRAEARVLVVHAAPDGDHDAADLVARAEAGLAGVCHERPALPVDGIRARAPTLA